MTGGAIEVERTPCVLYRQDVTFGTRHQPAELPQAVRLPHTVAEGLEQHEGLAQVFLGRLVPAQQ